MSKEPRREQGPADVIGCTVGVARISVGFEVEDVRSLSGRVRSGQAGGRARAHKMSAEDRGAVANKAADARWG